MKKLRLIETINILGPWVHGYFELTDGITIKDTDEYQRDRLFRLRDLLIDNIRAHYGADKLPEKTLCDVGCNAGYFLFELYRHFELGAATGFDPRKSNVNKAKFIAKQFKLPKDRFRVTVGNLFDIRKRSFDIVIMPGVLHHLDDHILACKRLYEMTDELLILETMALPDSVESDEIANRLELKDDVYKGIEPIFGVTGMKLESNYLDGATATSGIVSIPSKHAVYLALFNAGFRDIRLLDMHVSNTLNQPKYREFVNVVAVALKPKTTEADFFEEKTNLAQQGEIDIVVARETIEPLFAVVEKNASPEALTGEARAVWFGLVRPEQPYLVDESLKAKPYFGILRTLAHQPMDKIRLEFAKTLFHQGEHPRARTLALEVVRTPNADWRSVYRSYHVLSLIALREERISEARSCNSKALRAHPNFIPALKVKAQLKSL